MTDKPLIDDPCLWDGDESEPATPDQVQVLEQAGRDCYKRGGSMWYDNPHQHGGEKHAYWFCGFAEAEQAAEAEEETDEANRSTT